LSIEDAYLVQDELVPRMSRLWGPVAGYKVAFVRLDDRAEWSGMVEPINARLYYGQQISDGGTVFLDEYLRPDAFMTKLCVGFTFAERVVGPRCIST
jgi:2-keto-4-pentenoate hydratase